MHGHATVTRVSRQTDWNGKAYIRIDATHGQHDVHLYVPDGHPLAAVQGGMEISIAGHKKK